MPSLNEAKSCCPVCLHTEVKSRHIESAALRNGGGMEEVTHKDDAVHVSCPLCGTFVVTLCDCVNLKSTRLRNTWNHFHLSALLREQSVRNLPPFWLRYGMDPYGPLKWDQLLAHIDLEELLHRWPHTVPDRLDRTLCNLASMSPIGGHRAPMADSDTSLTFAVSVGEAIYTRRALIDQQLLDFLPPEAGISTTEVWLTPKGWARFHELTRGKSSPENPVFVAMWFGGDEKSEEMTKVFSEGLQAAIEEAGYRATRADLVEHNDWIMDKVFGDIRRAPFLVADFTEHRNGVYLEAGFARGLGIPVIYTCRKDHLDKAHFDTAQFNHVVWSTAAELKTKLFNRIVASIGEGPHPHRG